MNIDNRVTVTVKDQNGAPQQNVSVIVKGDADYIEKGITNVTGQVTLPAKNQAYTNRNGVANVDGYIVLVEDETEPIYSALVTVENDKVLVCLPDGKKIDYHNRTTVTVKTDEGEAVEGMAVNVYDNDGGDRTEETDKEGKVTIPPLNENIIEEKTTATPAPTQKPGLETEQPTGEPDTTEAPAETEEPDTTPIPTINPDEGSEVVSPDCSYKVAVRDNDGIISGAIVSVDKETGEVTVKLPDGKAITPDNRVIVGITDTDNNPVKGVHVTVIAKDGTQSEDKTNSNGIAVVPAIGTDITDKDGYAQVVEGDNIYNIVVEDTKSKIENAAVKVKDGKIGVVLPDTSVLDSSNQITVTVTDKDNIAVKGISVTVTDKNSKTATKSTDANGKIVVPDKAASGGGSSSGGSSGGGSGRSTVNITNVKVVDKDGKNITVSKSTDKDGNITITLPNGTKLDGNNYYTIAVTDGKGNAKSDIGVTLKDKDGKSINGTTDKNGQLVLPATEHKAYIEGYDDGSFRPEGNMTRAEAAAIFARNIAERKGESIGNKASSFKDVNAKAWYNQYISYLEQYKIIDGYDDNIFKPDASISRAEFLAMCTRFYRLFDDITVSKKHSFTDVTAAHWAVIYINSAVAMDWINGYADGTFKPDNKITRAEVVAIVNRVTEREADTDYINKNMATVNPFVDLKDKSYWAYEDIIESANTHRAVTGASSETWIK